MKNHNWMEEDLDEEQEIENPDEVVDLRPVVEETSLKATVAEMICVMVAWGILCEIVILILRQDILGCSIGLWVGVVLAAGASVHMAWSLNKALDFDEKVAKAKTRTHSVLRYVVILIVFVVILLTDIANPLTAFAGIMALKVSAYFQPLAHRVLKFKPRR